MKLDIPLELYKIFCVVARSGNMSVAAKELFITQPAVSMSIKNLEERMGTTLLIRGSKGIRTTAEGEMLYESIKQALSIIEAAENKYIEMASLESGEVRIGASATIVSRFLLGYIERFTEVHPKLVMKVTNRTTYESIKLLKAGFVDIAVINLPVDDDSLDITPCLDVHDCIVAGSRYAGLRETGIELGNLHKYPLMMIERGSGARNYIDAYAAEHGVSLDPSIELGSSDLLIEFARINMGLAFVTREFAKRELASGDVIEIPLRPSIPGRSVAIAKLKGRELSYAARGFISAFGK